MPLLQSEHIRLRAVEPEDLDILYRWENDTELWTIGNAIAPYSRYQIKEFIGSAGRDIYTSGQMRLMIDTILEAKTVGCIDLYDFDAFHQKAAVGIVIDENSRNCGIAAETLTLMTEYAFSFLKLQQLYCYIPEYNTASIILFEKYGFIQSGKLRQWIRTIDGYADVYVYQLLNKK